LKKNSYNNEFQKAKVICKLPNKLKPQDTIKPPNTKELMEKVVQEKKKKA